MAVEDYDRLDEEPGTGSGRTSVVARQRLSHETQSIVAERLSVNRSVASVPIPLPNRNRVHSFGRLRKCDGQVDATAYSEFRRLCDQIIAEVEKISPFIVEGLVSDEGLEVVSEIEVLLEQLYDSRWGKGENLKRAVVALQTQVNNAVWQTRHVELLADAMRFIRSRYLIDESVVDQCLTIVRDNGLDPNRGTIAVPVTRRQYRLVVND